MKRSRARRPARQARKTRKAGKAAKPSEPGAERQLPHGLEGAISRTVAFEWTIAAYDSRLPAVFSTPAMIGLMELAASEAIEPHLPEGSISVGTRIEVDHLKAVPAGAMVEARARFTGSQGRFLEFETEARAGDLIIGRGKVYRAIVPLGRFRTEASERG